MVQTIIQADLSIAEIKTVLMAVNYFFQEATYDDYKRINPEFYKSK